jgi:hypothetical protein
MVVEMVGNRRSHLGQIRRFPAEKRYVRFSQEPTFDANGQISAQLDRAAERKPAPGFSIAQGACAPAENMGPATEPVEAVRAAIVAEHKNQ